MRDIICSNWKLSCEQMKAQDEGGLTPTIFWTSTEFGGEMWHAGERERRTSYSDVLRSHRAGTARSTGGHCGDAGGPIGSQTTLYASEGSSGECAILSARIGTQPVRFNIADDLTLTATFPPMSIRWLGSSPTLPPFGISGFQKNLSAADGPTPMEVRTSAKGEMTLIA